MQRILTYVVIACVGASIYWFIDTYVTAARWQAEALASWDGLTAMQDWWFESTKGLALSCWWNSANNIISVCTAVAGVAGKVLWRKRNVRVQES
jgi:hypothetical protein